LSQGSVEAQGEDDQAMRGREHAEKRKREGRQGGAVVSMVGGLHGVTLLHSMGRAEVEERSYSDGVEWSGVIGGHSMGLHGVPRGDVAKPNGAE
jgi:hypothetical protein